MRREIPDMNWKKQSIGIQIGIGFVVILSLLIIIGFIASMGIHTLKNNAAYVIDGNKLDAVLAGFEVEHLNWSNSINGFLSNPDTETNIETDHRKCSLGQWLESPERKKYEARIPGLAALFSSLEKPHADLHQSASEISSVFKKVDPNLLAVLTESESDHLKWASQIRQAFLQTSDDLGIEIDPEKCTLGKWFASVEGRNSYLNSSPAFKENWEKLVDSHKKLHESAKEIRNNMAFASAAAAQNERKILMVELEKTAENLSGILDTVLQDVIRPNREIAERNNNVTDLILWSTSESAVNEIVIRSLLEMRRAISMYETEKIQAHWDIFEKEMRIFQEGLGISLTTLNSRPEFVETANQITTLTKEWRENANLYKQKMEITVTAQTSIASAQNTFNNQTMVLLDATMEYLAKLKTEVKAELDGVNQAANIYAVKTLPSLESIQTGIGDIRSLAKKSIMTDEVMLESVKTTQIYVTVIIAAAVLLGILFALFIPRGIIRVLWGVSKKMNDAANQVASAAQQVSASSQSLAGGTTRQADAMQETASALELMSVKTQENAANVHEADQLMKEANSIVIRADQSMTELSGSIDEISKASTETQKIVKTIDEIAFQTNLLALNAAVEAARAGEAGAGFSVVADEVRNLAIRAAAAAKTTSELIEGTVRRVQDGSAVVKRTNTDFTRVSESVIKVGELLSEIAHASKDQTEGIEQISRNISDVDGVTRKNASNAEESATASGQMNAQAEQMKELVSSLVVMVGGKRGHEKTAKSKNRKPLSIQQNKRPGGKQIAGPGQMPAGRLSAPVNRVNVPAKTSKRAPVRTRSGHAAQSL